MFESRRGQLTFFAIILITIRIEKNVKVGDTERSRTYEKTRQNKWKMLLC